MQKGPCKQPHRGTHLRAHRENSESRCQQQQHLSPGLHVPACCNIQQGVNVSSSHLGSCGTDVFEVQVAPPHGN